MGMDMAMTFPNIIGLVGVILILIAYFLIQTGRLTSDHLAFPMLNLIGASLHLYSLLYAWNIASFFIEIFWVGISIYGVWRIMKTRRNPHTG